MIFPIGDDQVKGGYKPIVAYSFIVLNVVMFLIQLSQPDALICRLGAIPSEIVAGQNWISLLSSMFMHGGWMHLLGNMLFLWVFADNIEAVVGNVGFFLFYMIGGFFAAAAHIYFESGELIAGCCMACEAGNCITGNAICAGSIPIVGASGAISAVLGAYMVMFPVSKIKVLILIFMRTFTMSAIYFLGLWILQQLINGFASIGPQSANTGGVAWWAHIGGFAFGLLFGFLYRYRTKQSSRSKSSDQYL